METKAPITKQRAAHNRKIHSTSFVRGRKHTSDIRKQKEQVNARVFSAGTDGLLLKYTTLN